MPSRAEASPAPTRAAIRPEPEPTAELQVERWRAGARESAPDTLAAETPVGFFFNGEPFAVMLATPQDLEDFAVGFSLSEGIIGAPSEISLLHVTPHEAGIEIHLRVPAERMDAVLLRRRSIAGGSGCGLCGTAYLDEAVRRPGPVGTGVQITVEALHRALAALRGRQVLNQRTGSVHAAAWVRKNGEIETVREDVGRHNALDKLIGALRRGTGMDPAQGFLIVTSRASFEMVQKAGSAGITLMAAVSAPTALAVKMAADCGLTLVGFARENSHVVYTHPQRLLNARNA